MTAPSDVQLGFAPDDDAPIAYMARTRDYYAAIGYTTPYRWAMQSPLRWSADASWKRDYSNATMLSAEELARLRREFDAQKEIARGLRETAA